MIGLLKNAIYNMHVCILITTENNNNRIYKKNGKEQDA